MGSILEKKVFSEEARALTEYLEAHVVINMWQEFEVLILHGPIKQNSVFRFTWSITT